MRIPFLRDYPDISDDEKKELEIIEKVASKRSYKAAFMRACLWLRFDVNYSMSEEEYKFLKAKGMLPKNADVSKMWM